MNVTVEKCDAASKLATLPVYLSQCLTTFLEAGSHPSDSTLQRPALMNVTSKWTTAYDSGGLLLVNDPLLLAR